MINFRRHILSALLVLMFAVGAPGAAHAVVTVTKLSNLDMGQATVTPPKPTTGTHNNEIGTNGTISYDPSYSGPGTGMIGRLQINGATGAKVAISCEATATLTTSTPGNGATSLTAPALFLRVVGSGGSSGISTGAAAPGTGYPCAGLGTNPATYSLKNTSTDNVILIDMRLNAVNIKSGATYTANSFTVRVTRIGGSDSGTADNDTDVSLSASFQDTLSLTNVVQMDWGIVGTTGTPTSACHVDLGTNDTVAFFGCFSQGRVSAPHTGSALISGIPSGTPLEARCDTTATLTNTAGASIKVTGIDIHSSSYIAAYPGSGDCTGVSSAGGTIVFNYAPGSSDHIFLGGRLDGGTVTGTLAGTFSTSNPGGVFPQVSVLIQ